MINRTNENKRKIQKNSKGITLIALIVTIVILLILAGITINTLTGDNGVINKTKIAEQIQQVGKYRDAIQVARETADTKKLKGESGNYLDIIKNVAKKEVPIKENEGILGNEENITIKTDDNYTFKATQKAVSLIATEDIWFVWEENANLPSEIVAKSGLSIQYKINNSNWSEPSDENKIDISSISVSSGDIIYARPVDKDGNTGVEIDLYVEKANERELKIEGLGTPIKYYGKPGEKISFTLPKNTTCTVQFVTNTNSQTCPSENVGISINKKVKNKVGEDENCVSLNLEEIEGISQTNKTLTYKYTFGEKNATIVFKRDETGESIELPTLESDKWDKVGYEFIGWCSDPNFKEESGVMAGGEEFIPISNPTILYAKWKPIDYTITLKNINGINGSKTITYNIETPTFSIENPGLIHIEGDQYKIFDGWKENPQNGIITIDKGTHENITYTATWNDAIALAGVEGNITGHLSVQDAVNQVPENGTGEVTLLKDFSEPTTVTIPSGKIITYNTNGKTLTSLSGNTIINEGNLNIIGNGEINSNLSGMYAIENIGVMEHTSGTIRSTLYRGILNEGTLDINGEQAKVIANSYGIFNGNADGNVESILKVTNGTVQGSYAIYNNSPKTNAVTIYQNGNVISELSSGTSIGIRSNRGTITVEGGNILAKSTASAKCIGISAAGGNVNIKNGTIEGNSTTGIAYGIENNGAMVTIVGTGNATNSNNKSIIKGLSGSSEGYGVFNYNGTLKLWNTNDLYDANGDISINQYYPEIEGSTYGVNKTSNSTFQFYDGKIIGPSGNALGGDGEITLPSDENVKTAVHREEGVDKDGKTIQIATVKQIYTVTYNINGGTGTVPSLQTKYHNIALNLNDGSGLSKSGYTFIGWNTKADGSGTNYTTNYTGNSDITLYAKWKDSIKPAYSKCSASSVYPSNDSLYIGYRAWKKGQSARVFVIYEIDIFDQNSSQITAWNSVRVWGENKEGIWRLATPTNALTKLNDNVLNEGVSDSNKVASTDGGINLIEIYFGSTKREIKQDKIYPTLVTDENKNVALFKVREYFGDSATPHSKDIFDNSYLANDNNLVTGNITHDIGSDSYNSVTKNISVTFTDSGSGITLIQKSTNGTTWTNIDSELSTGVSSLTKTITGLTGSGTYHFRAKDKDNNWSESIPVQY